MGEKMKLYPNALLISVKEITIEFLQKNKIFTYYVTDKSI